MKISKRYPVVNGDIDRAWLVDQLHRAKRPNSLLAVALSPLPAVRIAAMSWITVDVLIDFVLGDDDLTPLELSYLGRALEFYDAPISPEWLASETMNTEDDDESLFEALSLLDKMPPNSPVTRLVNELVHRDVVPYMAAWTPMLYTDLALDGVNIGDPYKPRSKRITRRRRKAA